jgi:hypothetical protein
MSGAMDGFLTSYCGRNRAMVQVLSLRRAAARRAGGRDSNPTGRRRRVYAPSSAMIVAGVLPDGRATAPRVSGVKLLLL